MEAIVDILRGTLHQDDHVRDDATRALFSFMDKEDAYLDLMTVVFSSDSEMIEEHVRQSASINFKNFIDPARREGTIPRAATDKERGMIHTELLKQVLQERNPAITKQMEVAVCAEIRHYWSLLGEPSAVLIHEALGSENMQVVLNALRVVRTLMKRLGMITRDEEIVAGREEFQGYISEALLHLGESAMSEYGKDEMAGRVLWYTLKAYHGICRSNMTGPMAQLEVCHRWLTLVHDAWSFPVEAKSLPADEYARLKLPSTHVRKWASRCAHRWASRYMSTSFAPEEMKDVVEWFVSTMLAPLVPPALSCVEEFLGGGHSGWCDEKTFNSSLTFIAFAIEKVTGWREIKPHVQALVAEMVLPAMRFTAESAELWEDDPDSYIMNHYTPLCMAYDARSAVVEFLEALLEKRKDVGRPVVFRCICDELESASAKLEGAQNDQERFEALGRLDGAMAVITLSAKPLKNSRQIGPTLEPLLERYILPSLVAPQPNLRGRAVAVFGNLADLQFKSRELFDEALLRSINLLTDPERPVQYMAAASMKKILTNKWAQENLQEVAEKLLSEFLRLMETFVFDDIAEAMQTVVQHVGPKVRDQIIPIIRALLGSFSHYLTAEVEASDSNWEDSASLSAEHTLGSIATALTALAPFSPAQCDELEGLLCTNIFHPVFNTLNFVEYLEVTLDILSALVVARGRATLSDDMWAVGGSLIAASGSFARDFIAECRRTIDHMIAADPKGFVSHSHKGESLPEALWKMHKTIQVDEGAVPAQYSSRLICSALCQCRGDVDGLARQAAIYGLECAAEYKASETRAPRTALVTMVWCAVMYDADIALEAIGEEGLELLLNFTHDSIQPVNRAESIDIKIAILGMATLLQRPSSALPENAHSRIARICLEHIHFRFHEAIEMDRIEYDGEFDEDDDDEDEDEAEVEDDEEDQNYFNDDDGAEGTSELLNAVTEEDEAEYLELLRKAEEAQEDGGGPVLIGQTTLGDLDDKASADEIDDDDEDGVPKTLSIPYGFTPILLTDTMGFFFAMIHNLNQNDPAAIDQIVTSLDADFSTLWHAYLDYGEHVFSENGNNYEREM